jgi:uncharacterized protein YkwD
MRLTSSIIIVLLFLGCEMLCFSQQAKGYKFDAKSDTVNFRYDARFNEIINFDAIDYNRLCTLLFYLTNEIRADHNLNPLEFSGELENSANIHARDMVKRKFFSHTNSYDKDKRTPNDRAKLCGISNPFLAENIVEGFGLQYNSKETVYLRGKGKFSKTPDGKPIPAHSYLTLGETLLTAWMNSKDHRANILSTDALQLGCGVSYFVNVAFNDMPSFYAVQNFQLFQKIIVKGNRQD